MTRRAQWKYLWSEPDGAQLYDLERDPDEVHNLVHHRPHREVVEAFRSEIDERWNVAQIQADVLASQRARRTVDAAMRIGRFSPWDYVPKIPGTDMYMRNHMNLHEVERTRRFPPPAGHTKG